MSDGQYFRQGRCIARNIAAATQVSAVSQDATLANARLVRVIVTTIGTTVGSVSDANPTGNPAVPAVAGNLLGAIPNVLGPILFDEPVSTGIFVTPGAGQVVNVTYD